jgi:hypothetical protein
MGTDILMRTPVWVWPLLAGLLAVGLRARRDRESPVLLIYLMPLMGILTLAGVARLDGGMPVWLVFAAACAVGALAGYRLQGRLITARHPGRVAQRGEWVTLAVLMAVFWSSFGWNVAAAVAPEVTDGTGAQLLWAALAGALAASLTGRALRVAATPVTPTPTAA